MARTCICCRPFSVAPLKFWAIDQMQQFWLSFDDLWINNSKHMHLGQCGVRVDTVVGGVCRYRCAYLARLRPATSLPCSWRHEGSCREWCTGVESLKSAKVAQVSKVTKPTELSKPHCASKLTGIPARSASVGNTSTNSAKPCATAGRRAVPDDDPSGSANNSGARAAHVMAYQLCTHT